MSHVVRVRLQIFESDLDEIRLLSKISQAFVSYIFANIDVLRHVIDVVDYFSKSKHRKKKKKREKKKKSKKKRKKKIFDFLEIEQNVTSSEKRNSDD